MNISELLRARSFLVLVELRLTSWEKRLPFCWTGMAAFGTSRTNRRHQVLSPIGPTTDKGGFRRELAMT